jgi:hypothetical protein
VYPARVAFVIKRPFPRPPPTLFPDRQTRNRESENGGRRDRRVDVERRRGSSSSAESTSRHFSRHVLAPRRVCPRAIYPCAWGECASAPQFGPVE